MKVVLRRWKSHAGYSMRRKRIDTIIIFILVASIIGLFFRYFEKAVVPAVLIMAEDQAETDVVVLIDKTISECRELDSLSYDDIIEVTKNENDEIVSVSAKTVKLNSIRSELSMNMNSKLDKISTTTVFVPLGMLLGFRILSGVGIRIPVRVVPYGTAYADFGSSFDGQDINRTIHSVYLEASATVSILVPFESETLTVNTRIPIAETVITGEVPESYVNIDGLVRNGKTNQ